ncbi:c-type cytochrome biogenesis protein CcmI [Pseudomonas abyssi]|jgi:cytochrome c-type biogenesis protein CcmH|uniref:C-type cytochrome biogenesis protein CcmI n=1 Tax=Pseudomonas abyssi TaxID=170540 RepID=A0A2A3MLS4_9PSED|nr:c-type cytochrome biogenesis protein CcmI [Pseudomonas abyssi]MAC99413.1 c-type cytochrome biogenesis protein CcmI [Pseudomonadales bacterium]PBK05733.1 c-type cytochrome biogenesis protein CcmI [Pseudomonas abyssi]|tara:strand:- start:152 stop:1363 length:1212 start_codon:yes stop_codon:yes gene_type:complete
MTDLWFAAAGLVLVAIVMVLWPLWRRRQSERVDRTALNVALYEERVAELEAQQRAGDLSEAQLAAAKGEASRLLLEDTAAADARQAPLTRQLTWVLIIGAVALPLAVLGLYRQWGAADGLALYREMQATPQVETLEALIDRTQRVVEVQPENGEAWYMLGRAYMSAQNPEKAADAFGNALVRLGEQPEVLAQLAQARYFANGNQLDAETARALDKAIELDPQQPTALGLLGIAAFETGDFAGSIRYWQTLMQGMDPESPGAQAIQSGIERARQRMVDAGQTPPPAAEPATGPTINLRVSVAPELLAELPADASVFVFARDPNGPPMPLIAKRLSLSQLPLEITLSADDAMLPGVTLDSATALQLVARVSPTGDAREGTHLGQLDEVHAGQDGTLELVIDRAIN